LKLGGEDCKSDGTSRGLSEVSSKKKIYSLTIVCGKSSLYFALSKT